MDNAHYDMDKSCRICGHIDEQNVHIFNGSHKLLAAKISTVYPIVLYENDPLPKNICKNCIYNVTCIYNGIQSVLKTQSKWIKNIYTTQPNHDYIRILNLIKNSTNSTINSIKITLGQDIDEQCIRKALFTNCTETSVQIQSPDTQSITSFKIKEASFNTNSSLTNDQSTSCKTEIKDIKTLLELNGCTLITVNGKNAKQIPKHNAKSCPINCGNTNEELSFTKIDSIEYNAKSNQEKSDNDDDDDEDNLALSEIAQRISNVERSCTPPLLLVKCRYCPVQFNSLTTLAKHQLFHMQLNIDKIYVKKYLHKNIRRARLISLQNRKYIRCLNCWHIFVDKKSIVDHWTLGKCDFYCQICGKEFGLEPKMLREHIPAVHGISFRSSMMNSKLLSSESLCSMSQLHKEQQHINSAMVSNQKPIVKSCISQVAAATMDPTIHRPLGGPNRKSSTNKRGETVKCYICQKEFQSMKARNSHMRKHKPLEFGIENKSFGEITTNSLSLKLNTTNTTESQIFNQVTNNSPLCKSIPITENANVIPNIRTKSVIQHNVTNTNHYLPTQFKCKKNFILPSVKSVKQELIEHPNESVKIIIKSKKHQQTFDEMEE